MNVTTEMLAAWVAWTDGPERKLTPLEIGCLREGFYGGWLAASGMEAQRAETGTGSVHDSPARDSGDAQKATV